MIEGVKYLTDEKGRKIAVQIDLKKHKDFITDYFEYLEDKADLQRTVREEIVPFEEVIAKFEAING